MRQRLRGVLLLFSQLAQALAQHGLVHLLAARHVVRDLPLQAARHLAPPKGGRFNASDAKSGLEWDIYRAQQLPGPDYDTNAAHQYLEGKAGAKLASEPAAMTLLATVGFETQGSRLVAAGAPPAACARMKSSARPLPSA